MLLKFRDNLDLRSFSYLHKNINYSIIIDKIFIGIH